jgi:hypothetical protein
MQTWNDETRLTDLRLVLSSADGQRLREFVAVAHQERLPRIGEQLRRMAEREAVAHGN